MSAAHPMRSTGELLAHMHLLQRPLVDQLLAQHPTARVMTAEASDLDGTIDRGTQMLVEPCDGFSVDGIYLVLVGSSLTVLRKVRMLVLERAVCIESASGLPEVVPLDELHGIEFVGRVVASCVVRKH